MKKYNFYNDYSTGTHPNVLEAIVKFNDEQDAGYGLDKFSNEAREILWDKLGSKNVDIHFVLNGTQANTIVLSSILRSFEAVIAVSTAHTNVHESGAIEATGHKIIDVPSENGKLTPDLIMEVLANHYGEHMVKPKIVFISNPTELGTHYTKKELEKLKGICKKNNLYLYLDGARLGQALVEKDADLNLSDLPHLVDAFYIGGTKNGALFGEAVVLINDDFKKDFRNVLKQRGALLAKGKLIGIQFKTLFENDLYFELAKKSKYLADKLREGITQLSYKFLTDSRTNQLFPIFSNKIIKKLKKNYGFYVWTKIDLDKSAIRLIISWNTPESAIDNFLSDLKSLSK